MMLTIRFYYHTETGLVPYVLEDITSWFPHIKAAFPQLEPMRPHFFAQDSLVVEVEPAVLEAAAKERERLDVMLHTHVVASVSLTSAKPLVGSKEHMKQTPSFLLRQVNCVVETGIAAEDALKFIRQMHLVHVQRIAELCHPIFPNSLVLSLLPLGRSNEQIAAELLPLLLSVVRQHTQVTQRSCRIMPSAIPSQDAAIFVDKLQIDPRTYPVWDLPAPVTIPVYSIVNPADNSVFCCIHIFSEDPVIGDKGVVGFRSAAILIGPTASPQQVQQLFLNNFATPQGWQVGWHSLTLYNVETKKPVKCCSAQRKQMHLAFETGCAALRYYYQAPNAPLKDIAELQEEVCQSNMFGWPTAPDVANPHFPTLCSRSSVLTVSEGFVQLRQQRSHQADLAALQQTYNVLAAELEQQEAGASR